MYTYEDEGFLAFGTRCLRGGIRVTIPGSRCSVPLQGVEMIQVKDGESAQWDLERKRKEIRSEGGRGLGVGK
jgi:hypothetical protein